MRGEEVAVVVKDGGHEGTADGALAELAVGGDDLEERLRVERDAVVRVVLECLGLLAAEGGAAWGCCCCCVLSAGADGIGLEDLVGEGGFIGGYKAFVVGECVLFNDAQGLHHTALDNKSLYVNVVVIKAWSNVAIGGQRHGIPDVHDVDGTLRRGGPVAELGAAGGKGLGGKEVRPVQET